MSVALVQKAPIHTPVVALSTSDIVTNIATACLKELTISLALGCFISYFVPSPLGLTLLIGAATIQLAVSVFFHSLGAWASLNQWEYLASLCETLTGANFAIMTGFNMQTLIHETGHALATLAVYKRPLPQIAIYPFTGGLTQYCKTALNSFGKTLGPVASTFLVVASGPGLALLVSSILLAIGHALKEKYPKLSNYLIFWGLLDFLHHAEYAFSAVGAESTNLTHDFVHLSVFGLNPVVAAIGILAVPLLIELGAHYYNNF